MDNGDTALFAWHRDDPLAYWSGNTETPSALWQTEKYTFAEVMYPISRWVQREWTAQLLNEEPWLADYPHLTWFFLPVLCSKDGRGTTRRFFREFAAGFPDTDRHIGLDYYESFLRTGVLDDHRYLMAGKLGTSHSFDLTRMCATMSEFTVARILHEAGYQLTPEAPVTTGHNLDYRATADGRTVLVEVTRPTRPSRRMTDSPVAALRETVRTKVNGQLQHHGGGAVLFVDCTSFSPPHWRRILAERPDVYHRPAVVFRAEPDGSFEAYTKGSNPLNLPSDSLVV